MARAITGEPRLEDWFRQRRDTDQYSSVDNARYMPKSVVVDGRFDWQGVDRPRLSWEDTVLYECHVRGLTQRHPALDEEIRGTYLGLASPRVLEHLRRLGVTAVELLPVQHIATEPHLQHRGLRNYWGYSPLGFCAPHAGYATGGLGEQVVQFKTMVRELHRAGLEVILDVVFNHSAEGDHTGPVLSLKGLDNAAYFRLPEREKDRYLNYTGCGNTLDCGQPAVHRLVLESLRYWAREMRVDGFRFDLATVLGREGKGERFDAGATLLERIAEDDELRDLKLIAEPWDVGPEGYQLGRFPAPWAEWNDRYRDTVRRFWRGDPGTLGDLATRLAGSRDLFTDKKPTCSVNFVACHDGFTLADLVSYEHKHNERNGEDNRDGADDNRSRNWGQEGPTEDPGIRAARDRARRNLLATLALSQGVPMLLYGDEIGRSQGGNNNAYCQDNPTSWVDWSHRGRPALRLRPPCLRDPAAPSDATQDAFPGARGRRLVRPRWSGALDRRLAGRRSASDDRPAAGQRRDRRRRGRERRADRAQRRRVAGRCPAAGDPRPGRPRLGGVARHGAGHPGAPPDRCAVQALRRAAVDAGLHVERGHEKG